MSPRARTAAAPIRVPELGSALGRLTAVAPPPQAGPDLDEVREALLVEVVALVAEAREHADRGDRDAALVALGRSAWLEVWERAVRTAVERVCKTVDAELERAAWRVRLPVSKRNALPLTSAERRAVTARLGSVGGRFVEALDRLEVAAHAQRDAPKGDRDTLADWQDALRRVARRLEEAWTALVDATVREHDRWQRDVERVARWRPTLWPVFALGLPIAVALVWLGLALGGYVSMPASLLQWLGW